MKIIKETSSKLVLRARFFSGFLLFWALGFGGIPLLMLVLFFFNTGVTTLSCQRVEPTLVNCERKESKLLGSIEWPTSSLKKVKTAKYNSQSYTDSDGDIQQEYWVSVIANNREISVFREFMSVNGVKGNAREMNAIATKINRFLSSNEQLLIVRQDRRWRFANLFIFLFLLLFVAIAIVVLNFTLQVQTFTFEKKSQLLRYKRISLLGIKTRCHNFRNIAIEIEEYRDSDDDKWYKLNLLLPSASSNYLLIMSGEKGLPEVQKMAGKLSEFIGVEISNKS